MRAATPGTVILIALTIGVGGAARAQVSPGPLARPHAHLEGNDNCTRCHASRETGIDVRCLECHREIAALRDARRGFHAGQTGSCARCHPDHAGVGFAMIEWPSGSAETFDHQTARWPLEGKHAQLRCTDCHQAKFQDPAIGSLRPTGGAGRAQRFTGLDGRCTACHQDVHRGQLGTDCKACHGNDKFKPASRFDHAKTAFALRGKHAQIDCQRCHSAERLTLPRDEAGRSIPLYKPLPHAQCSDCHRDPHQGRLGPRCTDCHTETSFHDVLIDGKPFDHSRTRYPLEGKHRSVGCTECHRGGIAKTPRPTFATCTACHQDTHGGQATLAGKPADCGACHTVAGYLPATYTAQRHAESGYPLQGKHAAVGCRDCHPKRPENKALGTAAIVIRRPHERCVDCHKDAHAGQFAAATGERAVFADCGACHRVDGFKPSTFDLARHAKTRLPLQGKHATTTCAACHGPQRTDLPALPDKSKLGPAGVLLTLSDAACAACHRDPHAARFKQACSECHDQNRFRPSTYDLAAHARCSFKLDGAHRAVPCAECHVDLKREPTRATLLLTRTTEPPLLQPLNKTLCSDCHESPHGVQFEGRARGEACTVCHQDGSFKPASRFDHDRDADFKLRGAHEKVLCSACHVPRIEAGRAVVVYHPVPAHCEDCHRKSPKGKLP